MWYEAVEIMNRELVGISCSEDVEVWDTVRNEYNKDWKMQGI